VLYGTRVGFGFRWAVVFCVAHCIVLVQVSPAVDGYDRWREARMGDSTE